MQALEPPRAQKALPIPAQDLSRASLLGVRRALVAYGSRFGNTKRVAEALANGLRRHDHIAVDCLFIDDVSIGGLRGYDFLAVGGPTEVMSASKAMKQFLGKFPTTGLRGKQAFAFDTRLHSHLSGSAGSFIEKRLEHLGLVIVHPHVSAFVRGMNKAERVQHGDEGAPEWVRKLEKSSAPKSSTKGEPLDLLDVGAEAEFEKIGTEIGVGLVTGLG